MIEMYSSVFSVFEAGDKGSIGVKMAVMMVKNLNHLKAVKYEETG